MCILFVYIVKKLLLIMVGFKKKSLEEEWVDEVRSIQFYFGFVEFFNFAQCLR